MNSGICYVPTPAEREVLQALVDYGEVPAAAAASCRSPHTIEAHLARLRDATGLRRLHQLTAFDGNGDVVGGHNVSHSFAVVETGP